MTAMVRDKTTGTDTVVRARYLLACDGGRTVGRQLGVELQGARDVMRIVSVYMSADLSRWARDPDVLIRWLWVPRRGRSRDARADGARPLGPAIRGVGVPPQLRERRHPRDRRRAGDRRHEGCARPAGSRREGPRHQPLGLRGHPRGSLPGRSRLHGGRRRASPSADGRARTHQRRPRRPQPLLEARGGPGGSRG